MLTSKNTSSRSLRGFTSLITAIMSIAFAVMMFGILKEFVSDEITSLFSNFGNFGL